MAVLFSTRDMIEKIELSDHVGVILNDFEPKRILPIENGRLRIKTCFQNVKFSFQLADLAKVLIEFLVVEKVKSEASCLIVKGYNEELKSFNNELLYHLVLVNLVIRVVKFNENQIDGFKDEFIRLFNEFYLDENKFYEMFRV